MKLFKLFIIVLVPLVLAGCEEQMSERDLKMQQQLNQNDIKRKELLQVAGIYNGAFDAQTRDEQTIRLTMEVKDLPNPNDTSVDPVLYPTLVGHLRIIVGDEDAGEYYDCPIKKSEFVVSSKRLQLTVTNPQFNEMNLGLSQIASSDLDGSWNAPTVGRSGSARLAKE